jgi:TolB-like protein/Flp pilus assembly protein TadD
MPFAFSDHTLDCDRRELRRLGEPVAVAPQVFDLLVYLIRNRERVISKNDLIEAVWGGRIVSDSALTTRINAARAMIGDSGAEQRLIRTVHRRGVRFVGEVRETEHLPLAVRDGWRPATEAAGPVLPDKPSIAILPFRNMSGDPDQEYFADGIAEDIITALSKSRSLFVVARNSSYAYRDRSIAVKDIGRELGVRYILEGSVRQAGNRVRVTAQLVEAASGGHLWAERYDRGLADIFAVQDEITAGVSSAIQPAVHLSERERALRKPPDSLDTWSSYYRGMWHLLSGEEPEVDKARSFFRRAIELDPRFAPGYAMLAAADIHEALFFRADLKAENIPRAVDYAGRAVAIDPMDAIGHAALASALFVSGRHAESIAEADLAVSLDPNSASAYGTQGGARAWGGRPREAIESLRTAMRLSPFDPRMTGWLHFMARAHYWAGDYEAAIAVARRLRISSAHFRPVYTTLIAALGQMGEVEEARILMAEALQRFGEWFRFRMLQPAGQMHDFSPEDRNHLIDGFRKAGVLGENQATSAPGGQLSANRASLGRGPVRLRQSGRR